MDERLFRLEELVAPPATDGAARLAGEDDAPWLAEWYVSFAVEAFGRLPPGFDAAQMVQRGVRRSRCWIWSDAGDVACLYTDLANPTSNKIYQAIGYRPVLDRTTVRFD
jgi:hypothetical protein